MASNVHECMHACARVLSLCRVMMTPRFERIHVLDGLDGTGGTHTVCVYEGRVWSIEGRKAKDGKDEIAAANIHKTK